MSGAGSRFGGLKNKQIGAFVGNDYSTVSQGGKRLRVRRGSRTKRLGNWREELPPLALRNTDEIHVWLPQRMWNKIIFRIVGFKIRKSLLVHVYLLSFFIKSR